MTVKTAHPHRIHHAHVHGHQHQTAVHPYPTVDQVLVERMDANTMSALDTEGQVSWRIPFSSNATNGFTQVSTLYRTETSASDLRRRYVKEGTISFWVHYGVGWLHLEDYRGILKKVELRVEKHKVKPETMLPLRITVPAFILHNIVSRGEFMMISSQQGGECDPRIIHDSEDFRRFAAAVRQSET